VNEPRRWVIPLREAVDPKSAGVKASTLGHLLGAGFPVPDGFVLIGHALAWVQ
jgi:phosphoenolpyruvate synthase/pyruvate phosphate dikinase